MMNDAKRNKEIYELSDEILLNKDCLSTWIQNKQFLSQIEHNKINELQNDIINIVFGDFKGLLTSLLKHYDDRCITHSQQLKLNHILANVNPHTLTSTANNDLSLLSLPDDCIINVMGFMDYRTKLILQYCCRTLSIISRKPLNCNNMKYLMCVGAYKHTIASLILSNDLKDNMLAIDMINDTIIVSKMRYQGSYGCNLLKNVKYDVVSPILQKILSCHTNVASTLARILNENISNKSCQKCVIVLMKCTTFIYKILPAVRYMFYYGSFLQSGEEMLPFIESRLEDECFVFSMLSENNHSVLLQHNSLGSIDKLLTSIVSLGFGENLLNNGYVMNRLNNVLENETCTLKFLDMDAVLKEEFFVVGIANGYAALLQSIVILDFDDLFDCTERKLTNIEYRQLLSNSLINTLNEKIQHEKIHIGVQLKTFKFGDWYESTVVSVNNTGNRIKLKVQGIESDWFDLQYYSDCSKLKFNDNKHRSLSTVICILKHLNHDQQIQLIKRGYFKNLHLDIYSTTVIRTLLDYTQSSTEFTTIFENYTKRWKTMNNYLLTLTNSHVTEEFERCVYNNEYDFENILHDINGYELNQSVIISTMRKQFNWDKTVCDSFYCIVRLILIMEVLDCNDEYIENCILSMIGKYYNNNISTFPSIPSTKYFKIVNKLVNMIKASFLQNTKTPNSYELRAILFDTCNKNNCLKNKHQSQLWKDKRKHKKIKCKVSNKYRTIRYKYHRRRA